MRAAVSLAAGLALAAAALSSSADAQFSGDPFDAYRNAYSQSAYPVYSNIGPLSRSYRYTSPPGIGVNGPTGGASIGEMPYVIGLSNQIGAGSSGGIVGMGAPTIPGLNVAPSRTNSRADAEFNRRQQEREEQYAADQQRREDLYFEAMNEKDPTRKAELLKQYRDESRQANLRSNRTPTRDGPPRLPGSERRESRTEAGPPSTYAEMLRFNRALFSIVLKDDDGPPAISPPPPGR